jgi:3-phenylpropionate/trans-cinnamate dioxygenase ferredoxin reductase subunit
VEARHKPIMASMQTIVVVGGSLAGLRGAEALRRLGFDGRLVLVGEENHPPYDRPPLSKEVLRGEREVDQIGLSKPERFDALHLDLKLGQRATSLDVSGNSVHLASGERLGFDGCLIATGARPRVLPGTPDLPGIHVLRTLEDCLAIRQALEGSPRVVVVGAGFIGAEVASSCRKRGLEVTVIEALALPMERALVPAIAASVAEAHRDHGVDLRCGVGLERIEGRERVERVHLADGSVIPADLVVVGIGAVPNTEWLATSGLALDDGLLCDASCAAAPNIVAAGDVARWPSARFGMSMRIEHWTNAVEQGEAAAERLLAGAEAAKPFDPVPFVWSDQHDLKIQIAGSMHPDDEMRIVDGSIAERRFVAIFRREERLVGALAFNRVRALMAYRRLLREDGSWDDALAEAARG